MAFLSKKIFEQGSQVEVCSKEDGFIGSFYAATILENLGDKYKVKYERLVEEKDESKPLEEIVVADEVRPLPPRPPPKAIVEGDKVDVFANDGWWVGTLYGKIGDYYEVYFEMSGEKIAYPKERLRRHLEYRNGNWLCLD